jgi:hypothetical protein
MPSEEKSAAQRKIDLDLFGQDSRKISKKQGSIDFLLGPRQRPKRPTIEGDDGELAVQLRWARLVEDSEILKSGQHEKLREHLDELLFGLRKRYINGRPVRFPSNNELAKLTQVIFALASQFDVKKSDFGDLLGAVKRIENRLSKVNLSGFADELRERLCRLPRSPASLLHHAQLPPASKDALTQFVTAGKVDPQGMAWEKLYATVRDLNFPDSTLTAGESSKLLQLAGSVKQQEQVARLLLMDLRRQQLEWDVRYGNHIDASLQWLYLLQRPEDFTRLKNLFCGTALAPDEFADNMSQINNALRQKQHRKRHSKTKN